MEIFSNVQLPYFNKRCILEAIGENEEISNYFKDKDATSKPAKLELLSQLVYSWEFEHYFWKFSEEEKYMGFP